MKKISLFFLLLWSPAATLFGQSNIQEITMYKTFGGAHFEYQKDTAIFSVSQRQVSTLMKDGDPLAYAEFKKARASNTKAGILGFIGGVMVIFPIGTAVLGGDPEWGLAIAGTAFLVASIPFSKAYKAHASNAVDLYNKKHTAFKPRTEYYLSGLGLRMVIKF